MKYWMKVSLCIFIPFSLAVWSMYLAVDYYINYQSKMGEKIPFPLLKTLNVQGNESIVDRTEIEDYVQRYNAETIQNKLDIFFHQQNNLNEKTVKNIQISADQTKNKTSQIKFVLVLNFGFSFFNNRFVWSKKIHYHQKLSPPVLKKIKFETTKIIDSGEKNLIKNTKLLKEMFVNFNEKTFNKFRSVSFFKILSQQPNMLIIAKNGYIFEDYTNTWITSEFEIESHFRFEGNAITGTTKSGKLQAKLIVPNFVNTIGESAFEGCFGLEEVILSKNVVRIGTAAFRGCTKLRKILLPINLQRIDSYSFIGCASLKHIEIPENVTWIGRNIVENSGGVQVINNSLVLFDWWVQHYRYENGTIASLEKIELNRYYNSLGEKFKIIGENAFGQCNYDSIVFANSDYYFNSDSFTGILNKPKFRVSNAKTGNHLLNRLKEINWQQVCLNVRKLEDNGEFFLCQNKTPAKT